MKLQRLSTCIGLIATSAIALSAESVRAAKFDFNNDIGLGGCAPLVNDVTVPLFQAFIDETDDISTCTTEDGFTLNVTQPNDGFLQGKKVGDITGIGISVPDPGPVPAEIQNGEVLDVSFAEGVVDFIDLGFMYLPGVFFDQVYEVANITATKADGTGTIEGMLRVTSSNTAEWSRPGGVVTNLALSQEVEGGAYRIENPFDSISITALSFTAPTEGKRPPRDSDYALLAIQTGPVDMEPDIPEPATLLGLGVVGGLMAVSRRRKSSR